MTNAVVHPEIPCVGCGYNLHALDPNGRCPECGTPVARSRVGDRLANEPAETLLRLAARLSRSLLSVHGLGTFDP